MLVMGDKEVESGTVSVRLRNGEDLGSLDLPTFMQRLESVIKSRELHKL
jgi:threonyl-tRNA synthetase